jgi:hypothetical protein
VSTPYYDGIPIIDGGFNDGCLSTVVLPNVAAMVAHRPSSQSFGVMACINSDAQTYWPGGAGYARMTSLNSAYALAYGANYVTNSSGHDTRQALVDYACASTDPVDQSNCNHDEPATSLRAVIIPSTSGTLSGAINSTGTTVGIHLSEVSVECCAGPSHILVLEPGTANSEAMLVTAGTAAPLQADLVFTVSRGWGGNQASHASGVAAEVIDPIHFNAKGYGVQAAVLADWLKRTVSYPAPFGASLSLSRNHVVKD